MDHIEGLPEVPVPHHPGDVKLGSPWAMATTLMPFLPMVLKSFPATPVECFIFSPTMATIERLTSTSTLLISSFAISFSNSPRMDSSAFSARDSSMAMLMVFSEEAWEMRMMLIFRGQGL